MYLLLWFFAIRNHDYYVINLLILPIFIFITFIVYLKQYHSKIFKSVYLKIIFLLFLTYNISYCSTQINDRYRGGWKDNWGKAKHLEAFQTITPYLRSLGIQRSDKVVSIPDYSFNISLYLMDQKGWTSFGDDNNDSTMIAQKIQLRAKYLFISDAGLYKKEYIKLFVKNKIGKHKNVDIYDIRTFKSSLEINI